MHQQIANWNPQQIPRMKLEEEDKEESRWIENLKKEREDKERAERDRQREQQQRDQANQKTKQ